MLLVGTAHERRCRSETPCQRLCPPYKSIEQLFLDPVPVVEIASDGFGREHVGFEAVALRLHAWSLGGNRRHRRDILHRGKRLLPFFRGEKIDQEPAGVWMRCV